MASSTEQRYAQIEKEALAITWACERFSDYFIGADFHVETDHKPLVPLLSMKLLDELRFTFTDALSRAAGEGSEKHREEQVEMYVRQVLPASEGRLDVVRMVGQLEHSKSIRR